MLEWGWQSSPSFCISRCMDGNIPLSARSCVAARGLLKISQEELAGLAGISISTLRRLERGDARVGKYACDQVPKALQAHATVEASDCVDAVLEHSQALVDDFGFEIRDVSGLSSDLLYHLIGCDRSGDRGYFVGKFSLGGLNSDHANKAVELMLWYGLLGVRDRAGATRYIFDYGYNVRRLNAEIAQVDEPAIFVVSDALYVGLSS